MLASVVQLFPHGSCALNILRQKVNYRKGGLRRQADSTLNRKSHTKEKAKCGRGRCP